MNIDFSRFDGTGRTPRNVQLEAFEAIKSKYNEADIHAIVAPTATGKSSIARALQIALGADVITISNALISQYQDDFPSVNFLKGKTHYTCKSGLSCKDWTDIGMEACESCPYEACKIKAAEGYPTFYNPMSYYYFLISQKTRGNKVLVIDEAHLLGNMILLLTGRRLRRSDYKFSKKCCNEIFLVQWLKEQLGRLDRLAGLYYKQKDLEKLAKVKEEMESLGLLRQGLEEDPQNYAIWISKDEREYYLNVKPLFPPKFLVNRLLGNKKVILMSGTLFPCDITDLIGTQKYVTTELPSPIPVRQRPIYYRPAPFKVNFQTNPKQLAEYILQYADKEKNTLIHSTYSLSQKLAEYMPAGTIINKQDDKEFCIEEFKKKGGLFLASGCAEGVDFKGDICRLNIIPKVPFADLSDPVVKKRMALSDGQEWYCIRALSNIIQMAGRSTRTQDDWSQTVILDPNFKRLFLQYKNRLPKYFTEAVTFSE